MLKMLCDYLSEESPLSAAECTAMELMVLAAGLAVYLVVVITFPGVE